MKTSFDERWNRGLEYDQKPDLFGLLKLGLVLNGLNVMLFSFLTPLSSS